MDELANIANDAGARRLRDELLHGVARLSAGGIDNPRLDAEVLLAHCLNMSRAQLVTDGALIMSAAAARGFETLLQRRLAREPVSYITGSQEFWSLDFNVTPDVLIPRPDTERLVEVALLHRAKLPAAKTLRILDLCTGSGAVAVSLARELPSAPAASEK